MQWGYSNLAGTVSVQGRNYGRQKGAVPPEQKFRPPKLPFSLWQFQDGGFFLWKPTKNSEKYRPNWRDDLFFFFAIN